MGQGYERQHREREHHGLQSQPGDYFPARGVALQSAGPGLSMGPGPYNAPVVGRVVLDPSSLTTRPLHSGRFPPGSLKAPLALREISSGATMTTPGGLGTLHPEGLLQLPSCSARRLLMGGWGLLL